MNPAATYAWDLGDGTTATTPSVAHAYGDDGVYVAKLTVIVNDPGGARTRDFAEIVVTNVAPAVELTGPDAIDEGSIVAFTGAFSDPEWLDTHTARWDWGDPSKPEDGTVAETHAPPAGRGTVSGSHAWGDAGTYTITLTVRDDEGASAEATKDVTVLNVAPSVRAPRSVFAYPHTVTTLQAEFTDPGWLDRHAATWHLGDARRTAIVQEQNVPPIGRGTATASHVFRHTATYHASCVVTDDDGASGRADTIVHVVKLRNAHFEEGFRLRLLGEIANAWEPYTLTFEPWGANGNTAAAQVPASPFSAQHMLFREGEYAQRIEPAALERAGLWQRIGANPGWQYQISAWYSLKERQGEPLVGGFDPEEAGWERFDCARLGIDPDGGTDPASASIVWSTGQNRAEWSQLAVQAVARGDAVTVFVEASGGDREGADVCFDDVELLPTCRVLGPLREQTEQCTSFATHEPGRVPTPLKQDGFTFDVLGMPVLEIDSLGAGGTRGIVVPLRALVAHLPFESTSFVASFEMARGAAIAVVALDAAGATLATSRKAVGAGAADVTVTAARIDHVEISVGEAHGVLVRICAFRDAGQKPQT